MSASAEYVVIDADGLGRYLTEGGRRDALGGGADRLSYGWSGYVLVTLLVFLDEQGITLMDSADG